MTVEVAVDPAGTLALVVVMVVMVVLVGVELVERNLLALALKKQVVVRSG